MSKKNEVLLSIALEGDQEVKNKLQAVGDAGKKSLSGIEKDLGRVQQIAGRGLGGDLREAAGKIGEAVAPLTEASGLRGVAGLAGLGGIVGRFAAGPAGIGAGVTGALVGLAKFGEETDRIKERLRGLGGGKNAFDQLNESAKKLGVSTEDLVPGSEDFLRFRKFLEASYPNIVARPGVELSDEQRQSLPQVFNGGKLVSGNVGTLKQFLDAQGTLLNASTLDTKDPKVALPAIREFFDSVAHDYLTSSALRNLGKASPAAANQVSKSLSSSRVFGRDFGDINYEDLATYLDKPGSRTVQLPALQKSLANDFDSTLGPAQAAHGVTAAFGALEGATKRLIDQFSGDHAGIAKGINSVAGVVDKAADKAPGLIYQADRAVRAAEYAPGGSKFIGPVRPEDEHKAPQTIGEVFSSDKGDFLGRLVGYLRNSGAIEGQGPTSLGGGNPFGVITDFVRRAIADPGALPEKPQRYPTPLEQLAPPGRQPSGDPNSQYDWQIAPGPSVPSHPATPDNQQRVGQVEQPQQVAGLSSLVQQILESVSAAAYRANKPDLKVDEPASGGIRGEAPSDKAVAEAGTSITGAGERLASALYGVVAMIDRVQSRNVQSGAVAELATGGKIERFSPTHYEVIV
ncbi:hypothetical protein [Bradyrhizobium sp. USDA 4508]